MARIFPLSALALMALAGSLSSASEPAEPTPPAPTPPYAHDDPRLAWGPCPAFIPAGCQIAVLHGDPAGRNADLFFKVPGDFEIPHHWHTSAERIVLVSGELEVAYDGQAPFTLKTGMYAYGPAKLPHRARCAAGDPCVLFIAFEEPVDAVAVDASPDD